MSGELQRWFDEGQNAARTQMRGADDAPCPWPIYSAEGQAWFRGWNSKVPLSDGRIRVRPENCGHAFMPGMEMAF